jgi:serine/threonine protein kinase
MWSCGAILCDMFMGSTPNLARTGWDVRPVLHTLDMPEEARRIVARLMIPAPAERATALQILQEAWVTQGMGVGMSHMNDTARQSSPSPMEITSVTTPLLWSPYC